MAEDSKNPEEEADKVVRGLIEGIPKFERAITPDKRIEHTDFRRSTQYWYTFPNGYGASVIRGPYTYGYEQGLWEMAVLDSDGNLTYDTPITDDVIGHLTDYEVYEYLLKIQAL